MLPSFLLISIAGISIPAPVPSSERIMSFTSSDFVSIISARAPPYLSTFLAIVTNEQLPLSTRKIGERSSSGSPEKSSVNGMSLIHPCGFFSL